MSPPGTMSAVHDFIKCIEGLRMMHIKRAMLASGRIMPGWPVQELNRENQNWYWGAPNQQICTIMSPPGTMNAVHDFIKCIEGLCMYGACQARNACQR